MNNPLLEITNLYVQYETPAGDVKALNGVSFDLFEEQIFCLVGESGSGKSTLALAMLGLLPDNAKVIAGGINFDGIDILTSTDVELQSIRGREISIVFQDAQSALNPIHTIGSQVEEVVQAHLDLSPKAVTTLCQEVLRDVGLSDPKNVMKQYPFNLSGGMCQRVMLASALVLQPRILIADEATSGLDVTLQAEILERLKDLCKDFHSSILFITHDLGIVAHMADRVGVLYAGSVAESADVLSLFREPRHPYTWSLLQALPRLDEERRRLRPLPGAPPDLINLTDLCPFLPRCSKAISRCRSDRKPHLEIVGEGHQAACYNKISVSN
ncbi:MAG: methionine ABC transporter ATP-binding protein [Chloroflexi bacterium]|nr:methionine ABC transporter ATP-binding protein [Chloroflexota bacterium]